MLYLCSICSSSFKSPRALQGHSRMHGPSQGTAVHPKIIHPITGQSVTKSRLHIYNSNIVSCKKCQQDFKPKVGSSGKFCSKSCSASYNNAKRIPDPIKKIVSKENRVARRKAAYTSTFRQTGLFSCKCRHCGDKFSSKMRVNYCESHSHLYKNANRNRYAFTFNVYKYPAIFDLEELATIGFYSPATNKHGMTRDHRISVNEAIANNYDPYYIKHPMNCQLMSFKANNAKKTQSSITYNELVSLVKDFDSDVSGDH